MSPHRARQPSLPLVLVLVLLLVLLFAWTLAVDVPPRFAALPEPPRPAALELPPLLPPSPAVAEPTGTMAAPVLWPPPVPDRDEDWCRDRLADALASLPMDASRTASPYFFVLSDEPGLDRLPLKETRADVDIAGTVAEVRVSQRYRNDGERAVEAIYLFPASTRAAVHGMRMTVGDRVITAELKERQQARQAYELARQEGRTASLLEQHRPNVLQARVANILPADEVQVELTYTETLAAIRYCYQRMLQQDWDLAGRVEFRFVIGADGSVVSAEVVDSDLGNPVVEDCVRGRLLRLEFPPPDGGGIVIVTYPFVFSPVEE